MPTTFTHGFAGFSLPSAEAESAKIDEEIEQAQVFSTQPQF